MAQASANAAGADFFGEGTNAGPAAPPPRATDPTGLYYLDTGQPTPLYYQRRQMNSGAVTPGSPLGQQYLANDALRVWAPTAEQREQGWKLNNDSGLYELDESPNDDHPGIAISNDPRRAYDTRNTPAFNVVDNNGAGKANGLRLAPGTALPTDAGQRLGTQQEADRGNRNIEGTGSSEGNGGAAITPGSMQDLQGLATKGQQTFDTLARERGVQSQDMYAQGAAAQGRAAPQAGFVDYGRPQTIARTPDAVTGNFGAQQSVAAPTLGAARNAAMGTFGNQQSFNAARVAPAVQARNAAGFLAGTAAGARGIADLDFGQANQSREALGSSVNRLNAYADQGPGESVAQAQLRMAQEQNLGAALSLARSGRGNGAGNMKMAISENAATNAETNMQAAALRAQESDAWRGRQLQAMGLAQEGTTNMRGQDITAATAQGNQAISREQIASNVDVSRAGLEQGLNISNAEQTNVGNRLQAQLSTDATIQQAALANARNVAMGQAGTQVNLQNAEQGNLMDRTRAQMGLDAATTTANLANARNVAMGQAGTQTSISNAESRAASARAQAELANNLAVAQGNSTTDITGRNLDARVTTNANNDDLMQSMYGYGNDLGQQQITAANAGVGTGYDYASLGAEIDWRALDRDAGIRSANEDRKSRREAAYVGAGGAVLQSIIPMLGRSSKEKEEV